jgi:DNA modification methylase
MAPEVVWSELPQALPRLKILDPMAGSGTTLVTARMTGHKAIGFDSDPLAVLLSSTWTANVDVKRTEAMARKVLKRSRQIIGRSFPENADKETRDFINYWFDSTNRRQLTALAAVISRLRDPTTRNLMWCAFSRMIITKQTGVSLAMDVSHSRPHKKYTTAPIKAFQCFPRAVSQILKSAPFKKNQSNWPIATVRKADARKIPVKSESIDIVITSPPYLNAIDYLRGHKLSLVWMGYNIATLRNLRSQNIGTEVGTKIADMKIDEVMSGMCDVSTLSEHNKAMLRRYVQDSKAILYEIHRVLRPKGKAVIVVGDCNVRDVFIKNSRGFELLGKNMGFTLQKIYKRLLPENRRYLPPPTSSNAGKHLQKRMREEIIITFIKPIKQKD